MTHDEQIAEVKANRARALTAYVRGLGSIDEFDHEAYDAIAKPFDGELFGLGFLKGMQDTALRKFPDWTSGVNLTVNNPLSEPTTETIRKASQQSDD